MKVRKISKLNILLESTNRGIDPILYEHTVFFYSESKAARNNLIQIYVW